MDPDFAQRRHHFHYPHHLGFAGLHGLFLFEWLPLLVCLLVTVAVAWILFGGNQFEPTSRAIGRHRRTADSVRRHWQSAVRCLAVTAGQFAAYECDPSRCYAIQSSPTSLARPRPGSSMRSPKPTRWRPTSIPASNTPSGSSPQRSARNEAGRTRWTRPTAAVGLGEKSCWRQGIEYGAEFGCGGGPGNPYRALHRNPHPRRHHAGHPRDRASDRRGLVASAHSRRRPAQRTRHPDPRRNPGPGDLCPVLRLAIPPPSTAS